MNGERRLTGRHVFAIFASAFAVIIGVNLALAYNAVATFPGLEVENSYVASQTFNKRKAEQESLGWSVDASATDDEVMLSITDVNGAPVEVASLDAVLGRATEVKDDFKPDFQFNGQVYVAPAKLAPGNWNIRMTATDASGTRFQQRVILHKKR